MHEVPLESRYELHLTGGADVNFIQGLESYLLDLISLLPVCCHVLEVAGGDYRHPLKHGVGFKPSIVLEGDGVTFPASAARAQHSLLTLTLVRFR